ncbi:MAG: hypothetical protein PHQ05_13940 [Sterolibacterium sp.]|nr:hypothetical protein [Sterolibacterium sp.]
MWFFQAVTSSGATHEHIIGNYWAFADCSLVTGLLMFMLLPPQHRYGTYSRRKRYSRIPSCTSHTDDDGSDWRVELREKVSPNEAAGLPLVSLIDAYPDSQ